MYRNRRFIMFAISICCLTLTGRVTRTNTQTIEPSVIAPGAEIKQLVTGLTHLEGPAVDPDGNIYFTQQFAFKIFKWWDAEQNVTLFHDDSGGTNGLFVEANGDIVGCATLLKKLVRYNRDTAEMTDIVATYDDRPFNSTNDLWIDSLGGIYLTDPNYSRDPLTQDGEHVYYLFPDGKRLIRVTHDLKRPNGIIGTGDGRLLYIADELADTTWVYTIQPDATLSDKRLFVPEGDEGMSIDIEGNVYISPDNVNEIHVFDPEGNRIDTITVPEQPRNMCFGGSNRQTLFITAQTSLYSIRMRVRGY